MTFFQIPKYTEKCRKIKQKSQFITHTQLPPSVDEYALALLGAYRAVVLHIVGLTEPHKVHMHIHQTLLNRKNETFYINMSRGVKKRK